jgi:antitoxin component YwqK of YwqJK toxin-antitoxin module
MLSINEVANIENYCEWHDNGQINMVGNYKNKQKYGLFKFYNKNGAMYMQGYYKSDSRVLDKSWKYYYTSEKQ